MKSLYVYLGPWRCRGWPWAVCVGALSGRLDHERERREFAEGWASSYADQLAIERDEVHRVNQLLEELQNKEAEIVYVDKIVKRRLSNIGTALLIVASLSVIGCVANAASGVPADCGAGQIQGRNP